MILRMEYDIVAMAAAAAVGGVHPKGPIFNDSELEQ